MPAERAFEGCSQGFARGACTGFLLVAH